MQSRDAVLMMSFQPHVSASTLTHCSADYNDPDAVHSFNHAVTIAMWSGLGPSIILGVVASWLRHRYFTHTVSRQRTLTVFLNV